MSQQLLDPGLDELSELDRYLFRQFGWGPSVAVPHECIHHAFERQAALRPDAIAVEHLGSTITYGEMATRVAALAGGLHERGVGRGDVVGLLSYNCPELLEALFAANYLGAIAMPIVKDAVLQATLDATCLLCALALVTVAHTGFDTVRALVSVLHCSARHVRRACVTLEEQRLTYNGRNHRRPVWLGDQEGGLWATPCQKSLRIGRDKDHRHLERGQQIIHGIEPGAAVCQLDIGKDEPRLLLLGELKRLRPCSGNTNNPVAEVLHDGLQVHRDQSLVLDNENVGRNLIGHFLAALIDKVPDLSRRRIENVSGVVLGK